MLDFDGLNKSSKFEFEFIDKCMCNAWVATAIIGAGALGAGASIWGSSKAADAQTNAANVAAANSKAMYGQTREDLAPYRATGQTASNMLTPRLAELTAPVVQDQAALEATPGYQFTKTQGLKAAQNSAAARGLGKSGAALKGATTFATGLADNTQKTQFDIASGNQTNAYTKLKGLIDTGENAAAQTGVIGNASVAQQNAATIGAGNAQAASSNAIGGAVSKFANDVGGYAAYKGLYGAPATTTAGYGNFGQYSPYSPANA